MATYQRFEDLPVWKLAANLAKEMFDKTQDPGFRGKGDLANQLQRAALSISNNIAEGFERGTTKELITFLYYARGSAGEVRSMLAIVKSMKSFTDLEEYDLLQAKVESISKQLRGWLASLQESSIKGQRHLTKSSKSAYEMREKRRTFFEEGREMLERRAIEWSAEIAEPESES